MDPIVVIAYLLTVFVVTAFQILFWALRSLNPATAGVKTPAPTYEATDSRVSEWSLLTACGFGYLTATLLVIDLVLTLIFGEERTFVVRSPWIYVMGVSICAILFFSASAVLFKARARRRANA